MAFYECVFIARQDISAAQAEALAGTFGNIITENGGTVVKTENWGLRTLAYKIKKNRKGHYLMLTVDAPAAAVAEMERNMRINEDVLRHLTVKIDKADATPSVMMQSRGERGERGGRRGDGERARGPRRIELAEGDQA